MLVGLLVAGFLLAHAAIHVGFIAPPPPATADGPAWPFAMDRAWPVTRLGLDPALMRSLALALVAVTVAGFALGGADGARGPADGHLDGGHRHRIRRLARPARGLLPPLARCSASSSTSPCCGHASSSDGSPAVDGSGI